MTTADHLVDKEYKYGFVSEVDSDVIPKGLSEGVVRLISEKKASPTGCWSGGLKAYRHWETLHGEEPTWANVHHPRIDFQDIIYYAAPVSKKGPDSLEEVDPEILLAFENWASRWKSESGWRGSPSMRSSTASRWRRPTRRHCRSTASSSALHRGHKEPPRPGEEIPGLGGPLHR